MHSAPAVSYPVGRSRFQGWLNAALAVFGVCLVVAWGVQAGAFGLRQWLALGLCLVTCSVAWWQWQQVPMGHLSWDGVMWNLSVDASSVVVAPEVVFDFQHVVLLQLCATNNEKNVTWVWLDRSFSPIRWMALRRAIYGPVRRGDDLLVNLTSAPDHPPRSVR